MVKTLQQQKTNWELERDSVDSWIFPQIPGTQNQTFHEILMRNGLTFETDTKTIPGFLLQSDAAKKQIRFFSGDFAFVNLHQFVPQKCGYLTVVREPVDRAIAVYNEIMTNPAHPLHKQVSELCMTLDSFVLSPLARQADLFNAQTRLLAGYPLQIKETHPAMLEEAKNNIEKYFALVGVHVKFDEFVLVAREILDLKDFFYLPEDKSRYVDAELSQQAIDKLKSENHLDTLLYEFAMKRFLCLRENMENFVARIAALKTANKEYAKALCRFEDNKCTVNYTHKEVVNS